MRATNDKKILELEEFRRELHKHDWYYPMSDDPNVYAAGRLAEVRLWEKAEENGEDFIAEFKNVKEVYCG